MTTTTHDTSQRLAGRVLLLLVACGFSAIGTGLTYPLTAIYLSSTLGIGAAGPGLWFGVNAIAGLIMTIPTGAVAARWGPRRTAAGGALLQALGFVTLAFTSTLMNVATAALLVGAGTTLFFVTFVIVLADMTEESQHRRCFAARYTVQNIGLGIGALLGGVNAADGLGGFRWLSFTNGLSYLALAIAILVMGPRTRAEPEQADVRTPWRALRNPTLRVLLVVNAAFVICGAAQLESTIPVLLHDRMTISTTGVGMVLASNMIAVIVLQPIAVRLTRHVSDLANLNTVFVTWVMAFAVGGLAVLVPGKGALVLLVCFAVLLAAGECLYSMSYYPLLASLAPASSAVQWSAWSSFSWCGAFVMAPLLGLPLVEAVPPAIAWLLFAGAAVVFATVIAYLRASRTWVPVAQESGVPTISRS